MAKLQHYRLLDGLRGLAAQPVLLSHSYALVFAGGASVASIAIGWFARLSVIIFFVLSGFVIGTTIVGEIRQTGKFNWLEFAIRRVARIYPPYLVAILFVMMLMLVVGVKERTLNTDIWAWLRAISFLFTGTDAITITPVWSLRLEVGLYVFAALAALIFLTAGRARSVLLMVAAALFVIYCWKLSFAGMGAALFAAGALASIFFHRLVNIRPVWIWTFVVLALALPLAWPTLINDSTTSMVYQSFLGVPLGLGLVALAHVRTEGKSRLVQLVLASGGWSYTLYIIHMPVVLALTSATPIGDRIGLRLGMLATCLLIANLVAVVVARAVERPKLFTKLIRRVLVRSEPSPPNPVRLQSH